MRSGLILSLIVLSGCVAELERGDRFAWFETHEITNIYLRDNYGCAQSPGRAAADQSLWCWGSHPSPVSAASGAVEIAGMGDLTSLVLGRDVLCGIRQTEVICSGRGSSALGRAGQFDRDTYFPAAAVEGVQVAADAKLYAPGSAVCHYLRASGELWCWGYGGNLYNNHDSETQPVLIGLEEYSPTNEMLAMTEDHACLFSQSDNSLLCWGAGGAFGEDNVIQPLTVRRSHIEIQDLCVANNYTCYIGGEVGGDDYKLNCFGNSESRVVQALPEPAGSFGRHNNSTRQLVCGTDHACLLRENGNIDCWGSNTSHQLGGELPGDIGMAVSALPEQVMEHSSSLPRQLRLGSDVSCVKFLNVPGVHCWGQEIGAEEWPVSPRDPKLSYMIKFEP
ncbi:MAG: RCC1 domain-containing protein [Myxococcota bacterium]|nr:RCC1 domain-containing protein [Myxococcota bacterium]